VSRCRRAEAPLYASLLAWLLPSATVASDAGAGEHPHRSAASRASSRTASPGPPHAGRLMSSTATIGGASVAASSSTSLPTHFLPVPPRLRVTAHEVALRYFLYYQDPATLPATLQRLPHPHELAGTAAPSTSAAPAGDGLREVGSPAMTAGSTGLRSRSLTKRKKTVSWYAPSLSTSAAARWIAAATSADPVAARDVSSDGDTTGSAPSTPRPHSSRLPSEDRASALRRSLNAAACVRELVSFLPELVREEAVLVYLQALRVVFAAQDAGSPSGRAQSRPVLQLDRDSANRLAGCLMELSTPGGPLYPTRPVRHAAQATLDAVYPRGRLLRRAVHIAFRLANPLRWPASLAHWVASQVRWILGGGGGGGGGGGSRGNELSAISDSTGVQAAVRRSYSARVLAVVCDRWAGGLVAAVPSSAIVWLEVCVWAAVAWLMAVWACACGWVRGRR